MKAKRYEQPLTEVVKVNVSTALLTGSPEPPVDGPIPLPLHPGAPERRTEVF